MTQRDRQVPKNDERCGSGTSTVYRTSFLLSRRSKPLRVCREASRRGFVLGVWERAGTQEVSVSRWLGVCWCARQNAGAVRQRQRCCLLHTELSEATITVTPLFFLAFAVVVAAGKWERSAPRNFPSVRFLLPPPSFAP